jgi:hypothetical protein
MTPTETNLLGLVKHLTAGEFIYFGEVFGRPFDGHLGGSLAGFGSFGWYEGAEPNADFWATADESREQIVGKYRRAWAHSDATIEMLSCDGGLTERIRTVVLGIGLGRPPSQVARLAVSCQRQRHPWHINESDCLCGLKRGPGGLASRELAEL